jgi:uncharacterized protein (TIGR02217 family)
MSTAVFPTFNLPNIGWPIKRAPMWSTKIQESISGKEVRLAYYTYPKYKYVIDLNALQSIVSANDFATFLGFYNLRQGQFDTFLYSDPDQNSVTGQAIGTGNGSTAAYQLVNSYGTFVEPVLAPNTVSAVYLSAVSIPAAGISAPTNGTLTSTAAGALGATTYYVKSTWVTNSGETLPAAETNLAVSASHVLNVAAPGSAPSSAIGWNVYVSNTAGGGSGHETLQNGGTPNTLGSPWVEPTSGLVAGTALPGANTTGWSVSNWGATSPGVLTFAGNVRNTIAITADFTFYYPCRFLSDSQEFSGIWSNMYQCTKLSFQTVKN